MNRLLQFAVLLLLLLALASVPAHAGIAILASTNGHIICDSTSSSATGTCTTGSVTSTGATLLVIVCTTTTNACSTHAPIDAKGNSWHGLTNYTSGTGKANVSIWYAYDHGGTALSVGTSETFTCEGPYVNCDASLYSGTLTTSAVYDATAGVNGGSTTSGTSQAAGSITPSGTGELIISGWGSSGANTTSLAVNNSLSILDTQTVTTSDVSSHAYLVDSSSSAINPTWSITGSVEEMSATVAAFKPAATTSCTPSLALLGVGRCG